MKICHLTTVHKQHDVRIFYKECTSLASTYETHLVVINGQPAVENKVQVHSVDFNFNFRSARIWHAVDKVYEKGLYLDCDVYHIHDPELLRIAVKLEKLGKKVIYDAHEDVPRQILGKYWIPAPFRKLISVIFEYYENRRAAKLSYICTSTPHIRDRFKKINPNTVDITNYPILSKSPVMEKKGKKDKQFCYIGGIDENRGITQLVKAFNDIDAHLVLAGEYSPKSYTNKLSKISGWKKVEYKGFLNREEVKTVMNDSLAGFVTLKPLVNYMDSLPVKMFEYMAMGLPIIASNFPLWKDIIEKNECGICVDPMKPLEMSEAIRKILENKEESIKMGERGRKMVEEKYNWEKEEIKLKKVYQQLLN